MELKELMLASLEVHTHPFWNPFNGIESYACAVSLSVVVR